ncbi:Cyclin-like protein [Amanita muscaria]
MATSTSDDGNEAVATVKKPLYESSTQFRNWRCSPEKLAHIRHSLNEAAVSAIRNTFEAAEPGSSANVSFLDADEELLLVKLYVSKIPQLCALFRFPEEVEATAITYLKRFYLRNTVMDWHPKSVMLTALFLATKTTNNPISIEAYASHIPKTAPSDVLDLEFLVAQSLGFEFAVWHAHRALWGIWLDLQVIRDNFPGDPIKLPMSAYDAALGHIRTSRLTDTEFIYAPSQIALAALSLVAPDTATKWADTKVSADTDTSAVSLPSMVESIKSLILSSGKIPDVESVREVDRRLRICKNPEKVPGTKAYLAKRAEEERLAEEKRAKKVEEVQKAMGADPFGEEIKNEAPRPGLVDYDDDDD